MATYNMTKEEAKTQLKVIAKNTMECLDIFIKDRDEIKSFNTIISKYGKKYWGALCLIAQKEIQWWIDKSNIEELNKTLTNKL